jgi:hypothetical protein
LPEFRLNFPEICNFFANFRRNFVSTLQPDLFASGIRGGKGDGGGGGVFSESSRK